ncbi:MAG: hypothetical protein HND45_02555 [Chloroflexi bacterium]|nr:hypothetical protein [Chloroflexota bacterium]NOG74763.1 hypothetical protein [Chloroflexota bacterium]WKZ54827.1 MAG: hypothetical protein QY324_02165 [Anaerolineales bacterium]
MIKHSVIAPFLLFLSITAGCQPAVEIPISTSTPEATTTAALPPATPTATVTPTEVPISSLPVDEIVQKFMDGDVDNLSSLSMEQKMLFSQAYAEKLNQKRGARPVIYNNESYIDPITGKFLDVKNGTSKQEQTIQMYLPAYENDQGYLMVQTPDGQWIQIKGSKDVKYEVTNDPFDPNIKWPDTEKVQAEWLAEPDKVLAGLTIPQAVLGSIAYPASMMPIFILDKELGEIKIGGFGLDGTFRGLIIEKDTQGNPLAARVVLLTGVSTLYGDNLAARSGGSLKELSTLWRKLEENTLYYLIYMTDQEKSFNITYPQLSGNVIINYSGLSLFSNQIGNNIILINGSVLMVADNAK